MMKHTLITGGAGFIGSHVAKYCINLGQKVIIIDDLSGGFKENIPEEVNFIQGSVTDVEIVSKIFNEYSIQYVFHLAAYAAEGLSHFIRKFNYENNLIGSINLINESVKHDIECFVFTSSIAVYGAGQIPMTEHQVPQPEDPYGISKYAVELDLKCAHEMFGLNYIIFRPHNVYGENQNIGDKYRNVIGIFINQIMRNEKLTIFGDGKQTRAFSHIDDVAPCMANSINIPEAYNNVFNIGADTPYTVLEVAETVGRAFNKEPSINFLPPRHEVVHAFSDHTKVKNIMNIDSKVDLYEGIKRMVDWAKKHGPRETSKFTNIEIKKNIPSSWAEWL